MRPGRPGGVGGTGRLRDRHAAERMLLALGREFRRRARGGDAAALLINGNADGSLKLTQSRLLTPSGVGLR